MPDYFRPTNRFDEIVFGALLLLLAGVFGYFGVRGALLFAQGSRSAPADPLAWSIGLAVCVGAGYMALRLFAGSGTRLPQPLLLVAGLGAIAGAAWFASIALELHEPLSDSLTTISGFGGAGALALLLWWRRRGDAA